MAERGNAMNLAKFRRNNFGLSAALVVLVVLVVANNLRWFRSTDNLLRDSCLWLTPSSQLDGQILLVYVEPEILESASPQLISLIQEIERQSPKKIAIEATGPISAFEPINRISRVSNLTIGFPIDDLKDVRSVSRNRTFSTGFIDLHHGSQPIYRDGITSIKTEKARLNSFEFQIVKSVSPLSENLPSTTFGIRYAGGPNTIANIQARTLLDGNMLKELIKDKIVLIGPNLPRRFHMLTPTAGGNSRMSRLEIRGNIVASLLNENYATNSGFIPALILLALVTLVSFHFARQTTKHWLPTAIFLNVAFTLGLFFVCFWLTNTWLPATALILAGLVSMIVATLQRFSKLEDYVQFWKMRSKTREAHTKSRFQDDPWKAIGDVTYQMFQPTRVVMMELLPGASHLKRVRSIGCDYSQIFEKRLDYKRAPYWDPIQNKQPLQSRQRGYFTSNPGVREVEYMVPLVHGVHTFGIIAIAMEAATLEKWHDFDSFLARYCTEMSLLIAGCHQAAADDSQRRKFIDRCGTIPEERAFVEIQSNSQLQDDLIERVDIAFDCSESAMATFDIYGNIIRRNSNLNRILQKADLSGPGYTCVDIISAISGQSLKNARRIFRDTILHNKSERLLVADASLKDTPMMMYLKPMQLQEDESRTSIETHGLLLEIVDGSVFQELRQWNQELSNSLVPKVLEKATKLENASALLQQPQTGNPTLNGLFGSVGETVAEIVSVLESCQDLRGRHVTESPDNFFLLNTLSVWQTAKGRLEEEFTSRSITIREDDFIAGEVNAFANPILLDRAFNKILEFLLGNAFDESEIQFEIVPQIDGFEFRFTNQGGGTPVDTLRKSIDLAANAGPNRRNKSYLNLDTAQIDQLQQIDAWVEPWGGGFGVENLPHCVTASLTLSNVGNEQEDSAPAAAPNEDSSGDPSTLSTQQ